MDPQIVKAIAEMALFLELSSESDLHPDDAVSAMEQLAGNLQMASIETRAELTRQLKEIAPEYGEQERFVADLPASFGFEKERPLSTPSRP